MLSRWAGPYTVNVELPATLTAGKEAEATVEVLTPDGRKVPDVDVTLIVVGAEAAKTGQHRRRAPRPCR